MERYRNQNKNYNIINYLTYHCDALPFFLPPLSPFLPVSLHTYIPRFNVSEFRFPRRVPYTDPVRGRPKPNTVSTTGYSSISIVCSVYCVYYTFNCGMEAPAESLGFFDIAIGVNILAGGSRSANVPSSRGRTPRKCAIGKYTGACYGDDG